MNKRVFLASLAVFVSAAPSASAHLRSGTVAVDYRATVRTASTAAYAARIYQSDRVLNLVLKRGHTVAVVGYLGESMFRLDGAGLWINVASPTSVVAGLVPKRERIAGTTESWRLERGRTSVTWRDSRAQGLPPGVNFGPWHVPIAVDGRRAMLAGTLRRYPKPAVWLWLALLGGLLAFAGAAAARAGRDLRAGTTVLAATAAVLTVALALVFSLDAYASFGTWLASFDELFFAMVGLVLLLRGPPRWHTPAAIGLGVLSVGVGISKGAIYFHSIVLAVAPGTITRVLATVAIGSGAAAIVFAGTTYARERREPSHAARARGIVPTA